MPRVESLVVTGVQCPHCGSRIPRSFARARFPVENTHVVESNPHGPRCRVIVVIDPDGENHQVHRVPDGVADRTVMQRLMESIVRPAA